MTRSVYSYCIYIDDIAFCTIIETTRLARRMGYVPVRGSRPLQLLKIPVYAKLQ